jgi:hypothetical protein
VKKSTVLPRFSTGRFTKIFERFRSSSSLHRAVVGVVAETAPGAPTHRVEDG